MKLNKMKAGLVVSLIICMFVIMFSVNQTGNTDELKQTTIDSQELAQEITTYDRTTQPVTESTTEVQTTPVSTVIQTTEPVTEYETIEQVTTEAVTERETLEPVTQPQTELKPEITESGTDVKLSFIGDFYLSPKMYANYQNLGISSIISQRIQDIFQSVDICVANHEYVSGNLSEENKVDYQQFTYLTPEERESILPAFSFDVMSVANNHMMDYGAEGLYSTIRLLWNQGIGTIGGGSNLLEAIKPYTRHINGKKIAIMAATRVVPKTDWYATESRPGLLTTYETSERFSQIKKEITRLKTEEDYDIVIMYVHWGNNNESMVLDNQVTIGHGYIDAGADIVIGSHAHKLQGMEFYNGKLICYGISNFLFENYHSDTMVLTLNITADNNIIANVLPCSSQNYYTHDLQGAEAEAIFRHIESMSPNVRILSDGRIVQAN